MIVELASLSVSIASLISAAAFAFNANQLANSTLSQAKEVAQRSSDEWRQQQWFKLYTEANSAHAFLAKHHAVLAAQRSSTEIDESMRQAQVQMRRTHGLAKVFPSCSEIAALEAATGLQSESEFRDRLFLGRLASAVEGIRCHAMVDEAVLAN